MKWLPWSKYSDDIMVLVPDDCHHTSGVDVRAPYQLATVGERVYNEDSPIPFRGYAIGAAINWKPLPPEVAVLPRDERLNWVATLVGMGVES